MERPLAYGYFSLTAEDDDEVSRLNRQVKDYADAESYVLAEIYVDRNMPPGRLIRPALTTLLDCLRHDDRCSVIVPSADHISPWPLIRKAIAMEIQLLGAKLVVASNTAHEPPGVAAWRAERDTGQQL
ncbi:hypothetical protein ThrDRAFT_01163 [Frankia casuarinae]|jgi:hypothetical protein|uniref:Resolvase/invertase-type recombinase catalytic domain-containing protein n=1 Tax=Frankia casuarinae (strain DSM 45818 / CECT 9043 / HFP020203 / CcI3) TaxID=106370 RepID=Q2JAE5_FRACC|nr:MULTISPECIES: recombinase family protein [Frankia]ABD11747.1 hypothetical protein Francci3_2380 [Frankia casuarinae]ETA03416.1 hypothetical protein CcI6DRAFT_01132 [Frankia sp. CcI6]EYT93193.1 hypothetical protein ThrDRAFT_01163 [Frankia casuarinae]KDA41023.1 hypothetical protein BMG523Draft_04144 [Frankia sp. BMG5.23]KFB03570.1 hypothetical protein ALLO2DRAFT_03612 [Frankia sp. Allo2]